MAADAYDIHPNDVNQGAIGDCYLVGSLAALANTEDGREAIRDCIGEYNEETNEYTVYLYDKRGNREAFQVSAEFPLDENGDPVFAQPGDTSGDDAELWVMLIEKAYAQRRGGYHRIVGGWPGDMMEAITGVDSTVYQASDVTIGDLADAYEAGDAIALPSLVNTKIEIGGTTLVDFPDAWENNPWYQDGRPADQTLVPNHVYYVTSVDREAGTVTIRNPWGWSSTNITMTVDELNDAFNRVEISPITE